jgi:uncharacterized membrane protein
MNFLTDFISSNFENCIWLAVILVALCPTLEGKIAIPLAMNTAIWGSNALSPILALILAFVGSMIPCFPIIMLTRKLKQKTSGFFTNKFLQKYFVKSYKIENQKSNFKKYLLLTSFVAVPLPLTGVWSGSIIAGISNLKASYSFCSIMIGSLISCLSITLLCAYFKNSISYIFIVSLIIIIAFLFIDLILSLFKQTKKKSN